VTGPSSESDVIISDCGRVLNTECVIQWIIGRQSEGSIIRGFVNQKWVPYSQRYLINAIPDTNHNANPTNHNTRYRIIEPSDYRYITNTMHGTAYITSNTSPFQTATVFSAVAELIM